MNSISQKTRKVRCRLCGRELKFYEDRKNQICLKCEIAKGAA
jgi:hypothetical protein